MTYKNTPYIWGNYMVFNMSYNYGFLFKKSSLPKGILHNLLLIEDFVLEADLIMSKGNGIEDEDIYNIVKRLYFPKLKMRERSGTARRLSRAIRCISVALNIDWEKEYENYTIDELEEAIDNIEKDSENIDNAC